MFRCIQCPKAFEDYAAIRRHLSIKHFKYSPYLCKICKKTEQFHLTATEEDMNEHFGTVHPGTKPNITLSRDKIIEDKIKAAIDECQSNKSPTSQSISSDFKNNLHNGSNVPSAQSRFRTTATEIGPISSHVTQEQTNGETTEIAAEDDIEIVFESMPQKVKDEVTIPQDNSLGLKNALRRTYDVLCDEMTVDTSAKEVECFASEIKQELSNNEPTGNITADKNDDNNRKMIEKTTAQRESSINLLENTSELRTKDLGRESLTAESNSCANYVTREIRDTPIFALPELQSLQEIPIISSDTQSQAQLNLVAALNETFNQIGEENICHDSTRNGQSSTMPLPSAEENVFSNENEESPKDLGRESLTAESNSCTNNAPIYTLPELQYLQGSPSNDTQFQAQLNSVAAQNTAMPLPSVEENVFPSESNTEEFNEHAAIEPVIQMRLRSSPNNTVSNLILRKRTLPMNDRHSRTNLPAKRSNPKKTNATEKLYKCDHCSYASAWKSHFVCHMRIHTDEKPFKCDHCSFACSHKSNLNRHVRTHTGEKPYKCDECPYASAESSNLKVHMRIHTGEKPFKCSVCSFASAKSSDLYVHIRTHTGKKPYKCSECAYAGSSSSHLRHHVRCHHSKKTE